MNKFITKLATFMVLQFDKKTDKENKDAWRKEDPQDLVERARHELDVLSDTIRANMSIHEVWQQAANVANVVMMAADTFENDRSRIQTGLNVNQFIILHNLLLKGKISYEDYLSEVEETCY